MAAQLQVILVNKVRGVLEERVRDQLFFLYIKMRGEGFTLHGQTMNSRTVGVNQTQKGTSKGNTRLLLKYTEKSDNSCEDSCTLIL